MSTCIYFDFAIITYTSAFLTRQKNSRTRAEIDGKFSKAYRMKLSPLEQKILICTDFVDFCRSGYVYFFYIMTLTTGHLLLVICNINVTSVAT